MIITRLQGGIGNQMFQYAAGRAISVRTGKKLFIDTSFLGADAKSHYTARKLELGQLNVKLEIADRELLAAARAPGIWRRLFGRTEFTVLTDGEKDRKRFFSADGKIYLTGYWQSEVYFREIRKILLKEFAPRHPDFHKDKLQAVSADDTVAVHVRRGDYVTLPSASQFHGALDMEYYKNALGLIRTRKPNARIFVFSDDPGWCRVAFAGLSVDTFMEGAKKPAAHDLILMSKCSHQVIANSSYSWWSAWLNQNPDKIVIAPLQWFRADAARSSSIYCNDWIRI